MKISKNKFEEIVYQKFLKLPKKVREKLENVEIIIEDKPSSKFLGLYQGVPFPKRKNPSYSLILPDRIVIFKGDIENYCDNEEEIEKMVEKVLFHEIGHYLGLGERELRKMGL